MKFKGSTNIVGKFNWLCKVADTESVNTGRILTWVAGGMLGCLLQAVAQTVIEGPADEFGRERREKRAAAVNSTGSNSRITPVARDLFSNAAVAAADSLNSYLNTTLGGAQACPPESQSVGTRAFAGAVAREDRLPLDGLLGCQMRVKSTERPLGGDYKEASNLVESIRADFDFKLARIGASYSEENKTLDQWNRDRRLKNPFFKEPEGGDVASEMQVRQMTCWLVADEKAMAGWRTQLKIDFNQIEGAGPASGSEEATFVCRADIGKDFYVLDGVCSGQVNLSIEQSSEAWASGPTALFDARACVGTGSWCGRDARNPLANLFFGSAVGLTERCSSYGLYGGLETSIPVFNNRCFAVPSVILKYGDSETERDGDPQFSVGARVEFIMRF